MASISDRSERERILDADRSFLVQAPAGSGKTELLIQRYLLLLPRVASPEEIVAVTFTKKAAGEMRARVLQALEDARARRRPETVHEARTLELARAVVIEDERRGWRIAEHPARLRIQTIDALCAALVRQMPLISSFGPSSESIEDATALYLEAARALIGLVDTDAAPAAYLARLLAHLDNDVARVEALLADMLARRDQWTRHVMALDRRALESALVRERERIAHRARILYPGDAPNDLEGWQGVAQSLLTKGGAWRKGSLEAQGLAVRKDGEALRVALGDLLRLPPSRYSDAEWEVLAAIAGLLPYALAALSVVFQGARQVDFTAVAQAALDALGDAEAPTDLALALDYRIRHLLVDEFQDTSITQYDLIARLTTGWEPGDGRTVFAVGDPMQSIYRFREAEVGEFLRTWASGRLGGVAVACVRLTANFRSNAGLVDWVNAAFARAMPAEEDVVMGAVPYTAAVATGGSQAGQAVAVHPFFNGDYEGEARLVVDLAARIARAEPGATAAILVRNRSHLHEIAPRLRAAGVRFRAIEIERLGDRPVIQDLVALTRALAHPGDRLAWLSILRAPWCGLTLSDLSALAEGERGRTIWALANDPERIAQLSADGRARLERLRDVVGPALSGRLRRRLRDEVEHAWLALGGPACVEDANDLEDAETYLGVLEECEQAGSLVDTHAFERRLEALWALPDVRAGPEDVQVMTIHKAKGLEFDHVIVPGLGRPLGSDDKRLFLWLERPTQDAAPSELLLAPIAESGTEGGAAYAWLSELEARRADYETVRLLYVAATRARRRLHLLGDARVADAQGTLKPSASTLLAKLWPAVREVFATALAARGAAPPPDMRAENRGPPCDQDLVRLLASWRHPAPPASAFWHAGAVAVAVDEAIEFSWAGETARHVGSVVHRWFQRIAEDALVGWNDARIEGLRSAVRRQLVARGVRERDLTAASDRVVAALKNAIADDRGRWILGPHRHGLTEHRITAYRDGVVERMAIDRMFEDAQGRRWIVDYKTSRHEGGDRDEFLDHERARYAAQLARYARAMGAIDARGLYFPLLGGWREL